MINKMAFECKSCGKIFITPNREYIHDGVIQRVIMRCPSCNSKEIKNKLKEEVKEMCEKKANPPLVEFLVEIEALVSLEEIGNVVCYFCKKESNEEEGRPIIGYVYNPRGYGDTHYFCQKCLTEILVNKIKIQTKEEESK